MWTELHSHTQLVLLAHPQRSLRVSLDQVSVRHFLRLCGGSTSSQKGNKLMTISRRKLLGLSAAGLTTLSIGGCAYSMMRPLSKLAAAPASLAPVSAKISPRITVHMFQTGWVAVKMQHRSYSGIEALRIPAIMGSRSWTEWMPVTAYAVEHPDGIFMVDTGETTQIADPDYTACDAVTGMFYSRNLQFSVPENVGIETQLTLAGFKPEDVSKVVMTHLHSDHMGGMGTFKNAEFFVSETARGGHAGALMCRIPSVLNIQTSQYEERQAGVFNCSVALTSDGTISIVPTPGHANGHQSVLIEDEGRSVCIVGDAAFSLDQIESGEFGGIVENVSDTRESATKLRNQTTEFKTMMLPTHDPNNAQRMREFSL